MIRKYLMVLNILLVIDFMTVAARAEAPKLINFQGVLLDSRGNRVSQTVSMVFTIYDQKEGGQALWRENHDKVEVVSGLYNIHLGESESLDKYLFNDKRFLGISINNGEEMIPRILITGAPYALCGPLTMGLSCWDLNANRVCDLSTEDANGDGVCDALDCQGPQGETGTQGRPGAARRARAARRTGTQGKPGATRRARAARRTGTQGRPGATRLARTEGRPGGKGPPR